MISDSLQVLVAEGDARFRRVLADALVAAGHRVEAVGDSGAAMRLVDRTAHEALLLDSRLPGGGGYEVCRRIRKVRPSAPVILMVSPGDAPARLREPGGGADGWIRKPFEPREVLASLRSLRRRVVSAMIAPDLLDVDGVRLDLSRAVAHRDGRSVRLTSREVGILRWLYNHRTRAVSREELLQEVWGVPGDLQTRTVDMTISNLRRKIEIQSAAPRIIATVKGFGYVWAGLDRG